MRRPPSSPPLRPAGDDYDRDAASVRLGGQPPRSDLVHDAPVGLDRIRSDQHEIRTSDGVPEGAVGDPPGGEPPPSKLPGHPPPLPPGKAFEHEDLPGPTPPRQRSQGLRERRPATDRHDADAGRKDGPHRPADPLGLEEESAARAADPRAESFPEPARRSRTGDRPPLLAPLREQRHRRLGSRQIPGDGSSRAMRLPGRPGMPRRELRVQAVQGLERELPGPLRPIRPDAGENRRGDPPQRSGLRTGGRHGAGDGPHPQEREEGGL